MTRELQLLRHIVASRRPDLLETTEAIGSRRLSTQTREELRGVVADELCDKGLDENDAPTKYGMALEALIDSLGRW
jgi:hypothetical protein